MAISYTSVPAEIALDLTKYGISATFATSNADPKMYIDRLIIKGNLRVRKLDTAGSAPPASATATASITAVASLDWGPNLSGLEWAVNGNFRKNASTQQFMNFNGPRFADFAYLATRGVTKVRLPVPWEMLQPILAGNPGSATASVISDHGISSAGALHPEYLSMIDGIYSAAAANGIKVLFDLHSYARFLDFQYVAGVPDNYVHPSRSADQVAIRPYSTFSSGATVQTYYRIFSLNSAPSLTQTHFTDVWTRIVNRYRTHAANGGYGLMNEPNSMPSGTDAGTSGATENYSIWPAYAQAAINAIRAIDTSATDHPIYVGGNVWNNVNIETYNPGFPLSGTGLIYDVHSYLDSRSTGGTFDYSTEFASVIVADPPGSPFQLSQNTGVLRLARAVSWSEAHNVRLALTENGMPVDNAAWHSMFQLQMDFAKLHNVEVYSWMGGNHWPTQAYAINASPQFHQKKTLPPLVEGVIQKSWGIERISLFDYPSTGRSSGAITVRIANRGYNATPISVGLATTAGILSTATVVLAAGANSSNTFTWTPAPDSQGTITYSATSTVTVPQPRTLYSYSNPVALATTNLSAAAMAIIGKYNAIKWVAADAYTDYMVGSAAAYGSPVRAISDSGYASQEGNAFGAICHLNKEGGFNAREFIEIPTMGSLGGKPCVSFKTASTMGLWSKKAKPTNTADDGADALVQPLPVDKLPFTSIASAHFAVVGLARDAAAATGAAWGVFRDVDGTHSKLTFTGNKPQLEFRDRNYSSYAAVVAPASITAATTVVIGAQISPTVQRLRVNRVEVASASHTLVDSRVNSMWLMGGFSDYYINESYRADFFGLISGAGSPTSAEMNVLEQYIQTLM